MSCNGNSYMQYVGILHTVFFNHNPNNTDASSLTSSVDVSERLPMSGCFIGQLDINAHASQLGMLVTS